MCQGKLSTLKWKWFLIWRHIILLSFSMEQWLLLVCCTESSTYLHYVWKTLKTFPDLISKIAALVKDRQSGCSTMSPAVPETRTCMVSFTPSPSLTLKGRVLSQFLRNANNNLQMRIFPWPISTLHMKRPIERTATRFQASLWISQKRRSFAVVWQHTVYLHYSCMCFPADLPQMANSSRNDLKVYSSFSSLIFLILRNTGVNMCRS